MRGCVGLRNHHRVIGGGREFCNHGGDHSIVSGRTKTIKMVPIRRSSRWEVKIQRAHVPGHTS